MVFSGTVTLLEAMFAVAKSGFLSRLKSALATRSGSVPTAKGLREAGAKLTVVASSPAVL